MEDDWLMISQIHLKERVTNSLLLAIMTHGYLGPMYTHKYIYTHYLHLLPALFQNSYIHISIVNEHSCFYVPYPPPNS